MSKDNEVALRIQLDYSRQSEPDYLAWQILEILWEKLDEINRRLEFFNGHVHRMDTSLATCPPSARRAF